METETGFQDMFITKVYQFQINDDKIL